MKPGKCGKHPHPARRCEIVSVVNRLIVNNLKYIFFLFVFFSSYLVFCQKIYKYASLKTSLSEAYPGQIFSLSCRLSDLEGYLYVEPKHNYIEVIGDMIWEGYIKKGQIRNIIFNVRIKDAFAENDSIPITINVTRRRIEPGQMRGEGPTIFVKVRHTGILSQSKEKKVPGNVNNPSSRMDTLEIPMEEIQPEIDTTIQDMYSPLKKN